MQQIATMTLVTKLFRLILAATGLLVSAMTLAASDKIEYPDLKFGFIKLTDSVPVIVAKEKGFFEEEGLDVTLEAQSNWKVLLDRVIGGELDGSHMLPGQALGATAGIGTKAELITPFAMGVNTLAVTFSNEAWDAMKASGAKQHPVSALVLKAVVDKYKADGKKFNMAMVFPLSTHNYMLRYWLAAGGINPGFYTAKDVTGQTDADILLSVTPPPQMPATLEAGTISGFCVGEPWNEQVVMKGIGSVAITADEIWSRVPEKIFGMRKDFAEKYPNTTVAIVKALIRAAQWIDAGDGKNREEVVKLLAQSQYVGADYDILLGPLTGNYEYEKGDKRKVPNMNVYYKDFASYPYYSDAIWFLTQMRRWGQVGKAQPDGWYAEMARKVYRPDIYMKAAKALVTAGKARASDFPAEGESGYGVPASQFIDGKSFDAKKPNAYLASLSIGLKGK